MDYLFQALQNNSESIIAITALCAVIISFVSISLTAVTIWLQRRHNFKSVMPIADINLQDYESFISVEVKNTGIGPLIINEVIVFNSDNGEKKNNVIDWLPDLPLDYTWDTFISHLHGRVIAPNQKIVLAKLSGDLEDHTYIYSRNLVRNTLSKLILIIKYSDIYGRKMNPIIRPMDWFGRTLYA